MGLAISWFLTLRLVPPAPSPLVRCRPSTVGGPTSGLALSRRMRAGLLLYPTNSFWIASCKRNADKFPKYVMQRNRCAHTFWVHHPHPPGIGPGRSGRVTLAAAHNSPAKILPPFLRRKDRWSLIHRHKKKPPFPNLGTEAFSYMIERQFSLSDFFRR